MATFTARPAPADGRNGLDFQDHARRRLHRRLRVRGAGTDCNLRLELIEVPDGNFWAGSGQGGANRFGNIFYSFCRGEFSDLYDFTNDQWRVPQQQDRLCSASWKRIIGTNSGTQSETDPAGFGNIWQYSSGLRRRFRSSLTSRPQRTAQSATPRAGVTSLAARSIGVTRWRRQWLRRDLFTESGQDHAAYNFTYAPDGAYPSGRRGITPTEISTARRWRTKTAAIRQRLEIGPDRPKLHYAVHLHRHREAELHGGIRHSRQPDFAAGKGGATESARSISSHARRRGQHAVRLQHRLDLWRPSLLAAVF